MSDSTRCAVMQSRAPAAVRTHLLLNTPTTADRPAMRRTIQNYVIASSATAVPMEIGAIGKFGGKGRGKGPTGPPAAAKAEKGKGTGKGKGKGIGKSTKGWGK